MTACSGPLVGTRATAPPSRDLRPPAYPRADHATSANQAASTVRPARERPTPEPGRSGRTASCSSSVTSLPHHRKLFRRQPVTPGATSLWGGDQWFRELLIRGHLAIRSWQLVPSTGHRSRAPPLRPPRLGWSHPCRRRGRSGSLRLCGLGAQMETSPPRRAGLRRSHPGRGPRMARGPGASSNGRRLPPPLPRGRGHRAVFI